MENLKFFLFKVLSRYSNELCIIVQIACCLCCLVMYPCFETFVTINLWFDLLLLFYILAFFRVPVLLLTVGALFFLRVFISVKSMPIFSVFILSLVLLSIAIFLHLYKNLILPFKILIDLKILEEEVENKILKDLQLFGSLNSLSMWVFLICNFIHFTDPSFFLLYFDSFSGFLGPASFLFSLFFLFTGSVEILLCFNLSTNSFAALQFICIRIAKILFGLLIQCIGFHYHCVGGNYDPLSSFEIVKSFQRGYFGGVATNKEEVNALRLYRTLDQVTPPPFLAGTDFVDLNKLNTLNDLLIEKKKADSIVISNAIKEAAMKFVYDTALSESENEKIFNKLTSACIKKRLPTFVLPSDDCET